VNISTHQPLILFISQKYDLHRQELPQQGVDNFFAVD
jgi:hypothetical protein